MTNSSVAAKDMEPFKACSAIPIVNFGIPNCHQHLPIFLENIIDNLYEQFMFRTSRTDHFN